MFSSTAVGLNSIDTLRHFLFEFRSFQKPGSLLTGTTRTTFSLIVSAFNRSYMQLYLVVKKTEKT
jgi:hypothetical protein